MIRRYSENPIIKPEDIKIYNDELEVFGVFNPGAAHFNEKIILLLRVALRCKSEKGWIKVLACDNNNNSELKVLKWRKTKSLKIDVGDPRFFIINGKKYLTSMSIFYYAESTHGFNFQISDKPVFVPQTEYETYGIEDPRITRIDDKFYITYTAVSENSFSVALASTSDFKDYRRLGIIFPPENKDAALFDQRNNNKFYCLHRPTVSFIGKPSIWIAESDNLIHWGNNNLLLVPKNNRWERNKIGIGPQPILTEKGWLILYHSCGDDEVYSLSGLLLERNNPFRIIGRTKNPIMTPKYWYEKNGVVPNVIFSSGWINLYDNRILIYYGAADKYVCVAETMVDSLLSLVEIK